MRRMGMHSVGTRVLIPGIGVGVIDGFLPGRIGWRSHMYYWIVLEKELGRHLFAHEEVIKRLR